MSDLLETLGNDAATAETVKQKCLESLDTIDWMHQINFCKDSTIAEAINFARQGLDGGREGTLQLQPTDLDFHAWMQYAHLCTILYNRTHLPAKYTIIRNCYHSYSEFNANQTMYTIRVYVQNVN